MGSMVSRWQMYGNSLLVLTHRIPKTFKISRIKYVCGVCSANESHGQRKTERELLRQAELRAQF